VNFRRISDFRRLSQRSTPARAAGVLVLFLSIAGTLPAQQKPAGRLDRWNEDLTALAAELPRRHANLHHTLPRGEFMAGIAQISAAVPRLTDAQVMVEIARLLARVGDGHTGYFIPWDRANGFRRYPLELWMGKDGPIVIAAPPEHSALVGARLARIGGRMVVDVAETIRPLLPLDNPFGVYGLLPSYVVVPELLHALGLVSDMERLEVEGEIPGGGVVRATLKPVPSSDHRKLAGSKSPPPWVARREDPYWFELSPDGTLFIQYNDASVDKKDESFDAFSSRLERFARERPTQRLVLDLRWNDGGSIARARPILHALIRLADKFPEGKLFVATSPRTFSAPVLLAVEIERHTPALFVGEPTGGRPNSYGELRRFRLPKSGIEIRYSAWYYQHSSPDDRRPAIFPDLVAEATAESLARGEDPALRAIAAYRPRTPISEVMRRVIAERGVEDALREYRALRETRFNEHVFDESELESLARELSEKDQAEAAIALAALNLEQFPWSAQAHFVLGDLLAKADRCAAARGEYAAAFEIDRSFSQPEDRLTRLKLCGFGGN
jgi:hypothetical protein